MTNTDDGYCKPSVYLLWPFAYLPFVLICEMYYINWSLIYFCFLGFFTGQQNGERMHRCHQVLPVFLQLNILCKSHFLLFKEQV